MIIPNKRLVALPLLLWWKKFVRWISRSRSKDTWRVDFCIHCSRKRQFYSTRLYGNFKRLSCGRLFAMPILGETCKNSTASSVCTWSSLSHARHLATSWTVAHQGQSWSVTQPGALEIIKEGSSPLGRFMNSLLDKNFSP